MMGDDIVYPSTIAFVLVHLVCIAAIWTGITWQSVRAVRGALLAADFSSSAPGITAISRIGPTRPAGPFQLLLAVGGAEHRPEKACCGGPPSTGTIICIRTPRAICIPRARRASSTAMSAGSFARRQNSFDLNKDRGFRQVPPS